MKKKIVIALGGNALGNNLKEQLVAVKTTSKAIADLIEQGHQVVVAHGNGPQVGLIQKAFDALTKSDESYPPVPLAVCGAMSQSYIGFDLQSALREELLSRGLLMPVVTLVTQVEVDANDPAFQKPTKPIGSFMTKEQADKLAAATGCTIVEDAGRGYRQVVASPRPVRIVEIDSIRTLSDAGHVVIASGGGGIPVVAQGNHLQSVDAVIDKDFASCKLAQLLDADTLIILTAVEKVAIHFNKPEVQWLSTLTVAQAKQYAEEGHFAPGSMLPKVQAACDFAASKPGRHALITLLEKASEGVAGQTGTVVSL